MRTGHVRRGLGFVDEDKALRIEIELALEPDFAPLQDVGPILLARVRGLFLRVSLWRLQKRHSAATLNCTPDSASRAFSSGRVMSGTSTRKARIRSPCCSVRRDSRSPPAAWDVHRRPIGAEPASELRSMR
jgi:hypothetical protein